MIINKIISLTTILLFFIGSLLFFSYLEDKRYEDEIREALQKDPYEIKKVQNFNYQPKLYTEDLESGSLIFLTEQGELYQCGTKGYIKKIKNVNLNVKNIYCAGTEKECFFIDNKGDLYFTSMLDSKDGLIKIEGISKVKSFSIALTYYGAVTEDGSLYMWLKPKTKLNPEYRVEVPFKGLSSYSPKLIPSISDVERIACSSNYMVALTRLGEVYECGIKEEEVKKEVDPIFHKVENLSKILRIAILRESDLIAISKDKIYRIGYPGLPDYRIEEPISYTINQMSSGYLKIAYVTNHGDTYLLGESFWYHDPTFDPTIPKKLNGIENADAVYGAGCVYVIKDNQIYIITRVNQSWGIK